MFADKLQHLRASTESLVARRQRQLHAFTPEFARAVRDVANTAPALEDLAETFPALLFALATHYGEPAARIAACDIVIAGGTLKAAADRLCLPYWLRRLPPDAFQRPIGQLPDDPTFSLRIVNALPRQPGTAARWLQSISLANTANGSEYSFWFAQHARAVNTAMSEERQLLMAAWAWFSSNPQCEAARLLRVPWTPQVGAKRALEEFNVWVQRIALADWLAHGAIKPWILDGSALGFRFVTLRSVDDFIETSDTLDNCLDRYADRMRLGDTTVAAISKNSKLIGCIEIGRHDVEPTMPIVVQVRGPRNRSVTPDVWQAAYAWIGQTPIEPLTQNRLTATTSERQKTRRRLWQPYFAFLDGVPGAEHYAARLRRLISDNGPRHSRTRLRRPLRS